MISRSVSIYQLSTRGHTQKAQRVIIEILTTQNFSSLCWGHIHKILVLLSSLCWGHILGNIETITCVRALDTVLHWYIAILQNINLFNDNFSFCTSLTRLYVVHRYVVVKEEMTNQPNVLYIGRHLYLVHKFNEFSSHVVQLHLYMCIHIHMHTHTRSRMNAYTLVHTHIHVHANIHAHRGHHTRVSMHTHRDRIRLYSILHNYYIHTYIYSRSLPHLMP